MTTSDSTLLHTDALRAANIDAWHAATGHRFVKELADDTIAEATFRQYLMQDYAFIGTLVELVAYAIAKAPTMQSKRRLAAFLAAVTGDETNYFERALTAVGAPGAFQTPPPLNDVTETFRSLMIETASNGSYAEILSILVPAEWIYQTWAAEVRAAGKKPSRFYLEEWIELHANPGFDAFVRWIREELDRELAVGPATQSRATSLFAKTVRLEVEFFDAVYESASDS